MTGLWFSSCMSNMIYKHVNGLKRLTGPVIRPEFIKVDLLLESSLHMMVVTVVGSQTHICNMQSLNVI